MECYFRLLSFMKWNMASDKWVTNWQIPSLFGYLSGFAVQNRTTYNSLTGLNSPICSLSFLVLLIWRLLVIDQLTGLVSEQHVFVVRSIAVQNLVHLLFGQRMILVGLLVLDLLVAGLAESAAVVRSVLVGAPSGSLGIAFVDVADVTHKFSSMLEIQVVANVVKLQVLQHFLEIWKWFLLELLEFPALPLRELLQVTLLFLANGLTLPCRCIISRNTCIWDSSRRLLIGVIFRISGQL